jgi:hypothetical protein
MIGMFETWGGTVRRECPNYIGSAWLIEAVRRMQGSIPADSDRNEGFDPGQALNHYRAEPQIGILPVWMKTAAMRLVTVGDRPIARL